MAITFKDPHDKEPETKPKVMTANTAMIKGKQNPCIVGAEIEVHFELRVPIPFLYAPNTRMYWRHGSLLKRELDVREDRDELMGELSFCILRQTMISEGAVEDSLLLQAETHEPGASRRGSVPIDDAGRAI
jgi:hypothetical protein